MPRCVAPMAELCIVSGEQVEKDRYFAGALYFGGRNETLAASKGQCERNRFWPIGWKPQFVIPGNTSTPWVPERLFSAAQPDAS